MKQKQLKWRVIELSGCFIAQSPRGKQIEFAGAGYKGDKRRCEQYVRIQNARLNRL